MPPSGHAATQVAPPCASFPVRDPTIQVHFANQMCQTYTYTHTHIHTQRQTGGAYPSSLGSRTVASVARHVLGRTRVCGTFDVLAYEHEETS